MKPPYRCPHCHAPVFSFSAKQRAHIMRPAVCPRCGKCSALAVADRSGAQVAAILILFAGAVVALGQHAFWWWLPFVALAVWGYRWCIYHACLLPASVKEMAAGRKASWISAMLLFASMFMR